MFWSLIYALGAVFFALSVGLISGYFYALREVADASLPHEWKTVQTVLKRLKEKRENA